MDLILTPAYGRDYNSKDAVMADYRSGKDFIIENFDHPYCGKSISIRDIQPDADVKLRYNKKRNFIYVKDGKCQ